ncbi:modifier of mdg4-like isoform X3 [Culicoides brevitarsis]|uniref:modifier of mdg4-like isoform X3 n=1 Tax=Culicoides brevitarsis TaxID=469753 RepID=UPI00307C1C40
MAEDEQFSLSWNNFNSNLSAGFHESLCRGDLVDVTLAADGQLVKAHRLVLSVCSPYFRKMFTQMPANQHAFVFLKDVSHAALKDLIQFMYCGEVNVKQDALPAFISTAEALQIKGLTETGESVPQTQPQTTTTVLTAAPVTVAKESTRITTVPVHQTIATTSRTFKSPRVSATTAYKLAAAAGDSEDSADDKVVQAMTMQAQATSTPATVHTTVKRTQKSITPQSAPASKRMKVQTSTADPLEAVEPTQITMHGDKDDEFINIPIEQLQNPKTEPHDTQYAEQASAAQVTEVEGHEQDTTYVEDDGTYGEIAKYDDSYFTEGDETAKAGQSSFGESYTATTDQGQEAQAPSKPKKPVKMYTPCRKVKYHYPTESAIREIIREVEPKTVMYVASVKGGVQVEYEGHLFNHRCSKTVDGKKAFIYRCNQADAKNCMTTVIVYDKALYTLLNHECHNHPTTNFAPVKLKCPLLSETIKLEEEAKKIERRKSFLENLRKAYLKAEARKIVKKERI